MDKESKVIRGTRESCEKVYIQGYPVEDKKIGIMRPVKVEEYHDFLKYYPLLTSTDNKMKGILFKNSRRMISSEEVLKDVMKRLKNNDYITLVHENFNGIKQAYLDLFDFLLIDFKEEDLYKIMKDTDTWFENRKTLALFNGLPLEDTSGNEEIARFQRMKRAMNEVKGNSVNFESIYTSVMTYTGYTDKQINKMTLYSFYAVFHRMSQFKSHEVSALFKTVDYSGNIDIQSWYEPKDYHDDGKETMSKEDLVTTKNEIK